MTVSVTIDGVVHNAGREERLIDLVNKVGAKVPQVCYHPQLGPIQTCDTCMVEVDGKLVRACATTVVDGMSVDTAVRQRRPRHSAKPSIAFSAITCSTARSATTTTATAPSTTPRSCWRSNISTSRSSPSPMRSTIPIRSTATIPTSAFSAAAAWRPARTLQVNETLSIRWEDAHPRVLWDGGATIGESSCVSCGHCVTVCPCNALMEKSMLGHAGFFTALPKPALDGMIDVVKGVEPETGYGPILKVSEVEVGDARVAHPANQDRLHLLRRGLQLRCLDQGPSHPEGRAGRGPDQRHLHLHQGQVRLGLRQQPRPPDHAADPRGRQVPRSQLGRGARPGCAPVCRNQGARRARLARPSSPRPSAPTKKAT